ncbi:MAG: ABC transporter substrate-binding protein [Deltaproteobacteria bacterium]|nr:ABC transporter substrate-binding protein [Deltaproteobacteria bacterium]
MIRQTKRFRLITLCEIGVILSLLWYGNAWAAESPLALVRRTTEQAVTVLQNPSLKDRPQERADKFWQITLPIFDTQEIAKRCLGPQWNEITEEQRQEFVQLFIEMVKRSYQSTLEHHTTDARLSFDEERTDGDFAEVDTRILAPSQEKPLSVNYRLHRVGDTWLIYDVVAENVSLVRNYRNQFDRILKDSSYEGLVQALKKKLKDQNV